MSNKSNNCNNCNCNKYIYMDELCTLSNIYDTIKPPELIPNDELEDFVYISCEHLYEYCVKNPKIFNNWNYKDILDKVLQDYIYSILDNLDNDIDYEDQLDELKYEIKKQFHSIIPKRSRKGNPITYTQSNEYKDYIQQKLDIIYKKDKEQPEQRTQEWFEQRHNLLSASTIWKALDKQNYKNSLIYEKCKPINPHKYNIVNVNSPFHWGQKYEPVSQMYYEYVYDATIEEFGCIPHSTYSFLGASPDGINIKKSSQRYGRMLEIKNIVNRDITGIPKKEYWVQTQLQMECCDLEECDFLECRFKEYENEEQFYSDGSFQKTKDGNYKGIMVQFYHDNKPYYEYAPFQCSEEEFKIWFDEIIHKNQDKSWVSNIFWYLHEVSCVLIERNKVWFRNVVSEMKELWDIIEKERVEGYEHRKPVKRQKKKVSNNISNTNEIKNIITNNTQNNLSSLLTKQFNKDTIIENNGQQLTDIGINVVKTETTNEQEKLSKNMSNDNDNNKDKDNNKNNKNKKKDIDSNTDKKNKVIVIDI